MLSKLMISAAVAGTLAVAAVPAQARPWVGIGIAVPPVVVAPAPYYGPPAYPVYSGYYGGYYPGYYGPAVGVGFGYGYRGGYAYHGGYGYHGGYYGHGGWHR